MENALDHAQNRIAAQRAAQERVEAFLKNISPDDWPTVREILAAAVVVPTLSTDTNSTTQYPVRNHGTHPKAAHGDLTRAIEAIVASFEKSFDVRDVLNQLREERFKITATRPTAAVGQVLKNMHERKWLCLKRIGSGSTPSIYRTTTKFPERDAGQ